MTMVPLSPHGSHIFVRVDHDPDMQRFHDAIRNRRLPENNFQILLDQTAFLVKEQSWFDQQSGRWYNVCKRCGASCGHNMSPTWQMHPCGSLKITLLCEIRGGQRRVADGETALLHLKQRALRLQTYAAWLLWDLVSEHLIELFLQHDTHAMVDIGMLLDDRLISPRVLNAAPNREAVLRQVAKDVQEYEDSEWSTE
ncbi:hypothetical protein DACRYDRAFT_97095 [Dacryopinax primogenitus]|uniref:Uncharacterized protein n=1 Tax=Dacryopinax primogenitus (strain DJM 731) TaxID=1858805 RepID=M5FWD5_DACPD|nr:uncharacterized protein DACRYDRAFT_97095 [Dacryopinax primogenitus]EJT97696.1 hypothetical protein DACRYDRAFT_97095 [Dacryopinax primogenitus]